METMHLIRVVPFFAAVFFPSGPVLAQATADSHGVGYATNPYSGMYGSMGNVNSPYYRQFHMPGMSGMSGMGLVPAPGGGDYMVNPYSGMYGSMGNVYSPYYRRFHQPAIR